MSGGRARGHLEPDGAENFRKGVHRKTKSRRLLASGVPVSPLGTSNDGSSEMRAPAHQSNKRDARVTTKKPVRRIVSARLSARPRSDALR